MPSHNEQTEVIKGAKIVFRNLSGKMGPFNAEGDRNFSVILEPRLADDLTKRNWRVKQLKDQDDGTPGDRHLKVKVNYKTGRPPRIVLVTSNGRNELGADEVGMIDVADIENVDMVLNGWYSDMAGGGYSAFLKTMFVTIREDELELLYNALPESPVPPADQEPDDNWNE